MKKTGMLTGLLVLVTVASAQADWFGNMDANKDGKVTQKEWVAQNKKTKTRQGKKFNETQSVESFKARDLNKDTVLTPDELSK